MPPPLPNELVDEILRLTLLPQPYLSTSAHSAHLRSCCLVSRRFRARARPALTQHVVLAGPKQARLFRDLVEPSQLVAGEGTCPDMAKSLVFANWMGRTTTEDIVSVMRVCSSIEEMRIHHVAQLDLGLGMLRTTVLRKLVLHSCTLCGPLSLAHLEELSAHNVDAPLYTQVLMAPRNPALRALAIHYDHEPSTCYLAPPFDLLPQLDVLSVDFGTYLRLPPIAIQRFDGRILVDYPFSFLGPHSSVTPENEDALSQLADTPFVRLFSPHAAFRPSEVIHPDSEVILADFWLEVLAGLKGLDSLLCERILERILKTHPWARPTVLLERIYLPSQIQPRIGVPEALRELCLWEHLRKWDVEVVWEDATDWGVDSLVSQRFWEWSKEQRREEEAEKESGS